MAGICFYFEDSDTDVWSGKDLDAWNYACKMSDDISQAIVINRTPDQIQSMDNMMDFQVVQDMETALSLMSGHISQVVTPWDFDPAGVYDVWNYDHITDWYAFGPAAGWNSFELQGSKITIPSHGQGALHSVHAATVILAHRYGVLR